ncbi:MAG TPA: hypothetical protein VFM93_12350 [Candidatus Limnocylindria bacterium]|nr:hypothetical protein [Candidatus Limnocylindria bacterium]
MRVSLIGPGLALAAALFAVCGAPPAPFIPNRVELERGSAAFVNFVRLLDHGDYRVALALLRSPDGRALPAIEQDRLIASWTREFGASGEDINLRASVGAANVSRAPLPKNVEAVLDLTATLEGTSRSCPPLPIHNMYVAVGRVEGEWFVLQDALSSYDFACRR